MKAEFSDGCTHLRTISLQTLLASDQPPARHLEQVVERQTRRRPSSVSQLYSVRMNHTMAQLLRRSARFRMAR